MYTGSYCIALGHNMAGLWFLGVHWGFLQHITEYAREHVGVLCVVVCIADLWCLMAVVSGCSGGLLLLWIIFKVIYLVSLS